MVAETLNLHFEQKLVFHMVGFYHLLTDLLQGVEGVRLLVESLINNSKLPLSKIFLQLKVIDCDPLSPKGAPTPLDCLLFGQLPHLLQVLLFLDLFLFALSRP